MLHRPIPPKLSSCDLMSAGSESPNGNFPARSCRQNRDIDLSCDAAMACVLYRIESFRMFSIVHTRLFHDLRNVHSRSSSDWCIAGSCFSTLCVQRNRYHHASIAQPMLLHGHNNHTNAPFRIEGYRTETGALFRSHSDTQRAFAHRFLLRLRVQSTSRTSAQ